MSNRVKPRIAKRRFKCPSCNNKQATKHTLPSGALIYICRKCKKSYQLKEERHEETLNFSSAGRELNIPDVM